MKYINDCWSRVKTEWWPWSRRSGSRRSRRAKWSKRTIVKIIRPPNRSLVKLIKCTIDSPLIDINHLQLYLITLIVLSFYFSS